MRRRDFLKLLGSAAVGAGAIAAGVKIALPEAAPVAGISTRMPGGIRGLVYHIDNKTGSYLGLADARPLHNLKPATVESACEPLTRCTLENFKRKVLAASNREC